MALLDNELQLVFRPYRVLLQNNENDEAECNALLCLAYLLILESNSFYAFQKDCPILQSHSK